MAAQQMDPEVYKKWNSFYPSYIDASLTIPKGRRIPTACAVDKPHILECVEAFKALGLPHVLEHKFYSRDILRPGRIKYDVSENPDAANKKKLLKLIAAEIPKLKSRTTPPALQQAKQSGGGGKKGKKKK